MQLESLRLEARSRFLPLWPLAAIAAAWMPVLFLVSRADFAFHNDYVSASLKANNLLTHPEHGQLLTIGRPIGAALLQLYHRSFDSIDAMGTAHLLGVLLGFLLSSVLYAYLRRGLGLERALAAATAAGLAMLPSVLIGVLWMTTQPPNLLCILYVSAIYALHALYGRRSSWMMPLLLLAWLAAFLIYPPSALFVCALVLARLIFSEPGADGGRALIRTVGIEALIIAGAMLAFLIFAKVLYDPLMRGFGVDIARAAVDENLVRRYDFQLAGVWAVIEKTTTFLAFSMRLWVISDQGGVTALLALLCGLGVVAQIRRFGPTRTRLAAVVLSAALPVLAIAPVSVSNFDMFAFRAGAGVQACLAVLVFRGIGEFGRLWVVWRRRRADPALVRRMVFSAAPPAVLGLVVVTTIAAWEIKPVIDDKARELTFVVTTIEDYAQKYGGIPKGTRTDAVLNIAEKGREARAPYYDLGLAGRHECCWAFMVLVGADRYLSRARRPGPPPAQPPAASGNLLFDFRSVPSMP